MLLKQLNLNCHSFMAKQGLKDVIVGSNVLSVKTIAGHMYVKERVGFYRKKKLGHAN